LRCYERARDLFGVDDQGHGVAIDRDLVDGLEVDQARRAVDGCPEGAIRLTP
jgi:ferredoxin